MAKIIITEELAEYAILGGALLGGGGGGAIDKGRINIREALSGGVLTLVDIDDVSPDTILVTGSAVGAPAATEAKVTPAEYVRVTEILAENGCPAPGGFIPNECGGSSITNGWIPAALTGLPLVDALCNGRAHPTGVMGSMGLHRDKTYLSRQAAAGGNREKGLYLEIHALGNLESTAALVRSAADKAGGLVAVARNPVKASYAKKYAACGALKQAIELGRRMKNAEAEGAEAVVQAVINYLGGSIVTRGAVTEKKLVTRGGFDSGVIGIGDYEATFWNEYMTLEKGSQRLGTFPDLIMTVTAGGADPGKPVTTAEIRQGDEVYLLCIPKESLILGEGMRCTELLQTIEPVVGKRIL
ncbi:MAG: DUF917 family protein [Fusobacteriaceae bacterium]|jgi:DUF917 family protein|nr:DUF917 family protein [Fusobacteriaceae bacterium]